MNENTVKFKSKKFAVIIIRLYQFLCNEKKQILQKVNVQSAGKIFFQNYILL